MEQLLVGDNVYIINDDGSRIVISVVGDTLKSKQLFDDPVELDKIANKLKIPKVP